MWKTAKYFMGWKIDGTLTQLDENNKLVKKLVEIANIMNDWFITKVNTIRNGIPIQNDYNMNACKKIMQNKNCQFTLGQTDVTEVKKVIKNLKSSKSIG